VEVPNMAIAALPGKTCHSSKHFRAHARHVLSRWAHWWLHVYLGW